MECEPAHTLRQKEPYVPFLPLLAQSVSVDPIQSSMLGILGGFCVVVTIAVNIASRLRV